jgi:hypothetical protein
MGVTKHAGPAAVSTPSLANPIWHPDSRVTVLVYACAVPAVTAEERAAAAVKRGKKSEREELQDMFDQVSEVVSVSLLWLCFVPDIMILPVRESPDGSYSCC